MSNSTVEGQLQTVRRLPSGYTAPRFDTKASRDSWKLCRKARIEVFGIGAYVRQRQYTPIIHGMKIEECQNPVDANTELYRVDPRLKEAGV